MVKLDLLGIVVDDNKAEFTGNWSEGHGLPNFVGAGYQYSNQVDASVKYTFTPTKAGSYELRLAWHPHENRNTAVACTLPDGKAVSLNQKAPPVGAGSEQGFHTLGTVELKANQPATVVLKSNGQGQVHADALWVVEAGK
jgi:hypothetical protein